MSTVDGNFSDGFSTAAFSTATSTDIGRKSITPGLIVLCIFLFAGCIVSAVANLFVLLSYKFEKKLRTTFAILVGNLAFMDLLVSVIPMLFFTINILYSYWPLGRLLCGIWVVVDYNSVFASSYMLAAISIDRLWSIKWSIHYRNHNTKKKAAIVVIVVWLLVFVVALYPTISDRILRTRDYYCHFVPAENPQFVIALAFLGHHIPCIVIIACYIIVWIEMRKLFKTRPQDKAAAAAKAKAKTMPDAVSVAPTTFVATSGTTADPTPGTSKDPDVGQNAGGTETADNNAESAAAEDNKKKTDEKKEPKNEHPQQQAQMQQQKKQAANAPATSDAKARADRERKSFVTLSYIVIGYVICWVPFHFVYDVSFIRPELVSEDLYTAFFWLTYVNSAINPFLYAFSSSDLRNAVVKIVKCRCTSK